MYSQPHHRRVKEQMVWKRSRFTAILQLGWLADQLGLPGTEGFLWMQEFHFILFYFVISFHFILFVCMEDGGTFHFKTRKIPANQDSLVTYPHCTHRCSPTLLVLKHFILCKELNPYAHTHTPQNSPGIYVPFYRLPSEATLSPEIFSKTPALCR